MNSGSTEDNYLIFEALHFAANRHKNQKRKGADYAPYINHLIHVAKLLVQVGGINDTDLIIAAILHDVIEDTVNNETEQNGLTELINQKFGEKVLKIVLEVTDEKSLPKHIRKKLQVVETPKKSEEAKTLKIADKISNLMDIIHHPPINWEKEEKIEYFEWAKQVVDGIRGTNKKLESLFYNIYEESSLID